MARSDKVAAVAELVERFRAADAVLLTEYRGLTVKQLKQLRRSLGDNANYAVVKNTLAALAAKEVGLDFLAEDLTGPTAIAFVSGEPVEAAKALRDFAKENPALVLKSGAMDGVQLSAEGVKKLADLESREVLLAKAAGALKAKVAQAAYVFNALPSKTVRTIDALRDKQEQAA
ncbi:50S ribosomal protein L10 [Schaalia canis]|uniref:Large ribosomal subunit protein uL10 n=1 Tax=Schaalia canis TaxID=100469 RepID=A0A3P1SF75_9ACTO|nr:50S ribosomal protein L10 [Schaalia canis]RRC95656.1 50S ribosomal protein L10 [Schaalia canis]